MNIASTLPQEADFFDETGLLKEFKPPVQQQQQQYQQMGGMFVLKKIPIASLTPGSVSESVPDLASDPVPTPRFPIPRISAHGSSNSISNRFFQHFRYVDFERNQ